MMNTITIMGRLAKDPVLRTTATGKPVCSFTVAVEKPGREEGADFFYCTAWDRTAEFVNTYFQKGAAIALTGRLSTRSYEDKDGNKRTLTEIVAREVSFCSGKKDNAKTAPKTSMDVAVDEEDDDVDLPF